MTNTRRLTLTLLISAAIFGFVLVTGAAIQKAKNKSGQSSTLSRPPQDDDLFVGTVTQKASGRRTVPVLVQTKDVPAALLYAEIMADKSRPMAQRKIAARAATRQRVAQIRQRQQQLSGVLGARFNAREIYRVQRALSGIAVEVSEDRLAEIRGLAGVQSVIPMEPEFPNNASSVPFIGTPQVWDNTFGLNVKGDGIKIGIIDTGIDYQHANFAGTGILADYQANNRTVAPDAYFPTPKVAGGFDFAGDNYNGNAATIAPDPDPMDCNGHGTHVAGIAAGLGVQSDGTTYPGPYNSLINFSGLRIGPGTAPGATLYALRVFGCGGGSNLTVQAIDWAMDP